MVFLNLTLMGCVYSITDTDISVSVSVVELTLGEFAINGATSSSLTNVRDTESLDRCG